MHQWPVINSAAVFVIILLAACTPRGAMVVVGDVENSRQVLPVYFATTRTMDESGQDAFGSGRSSVATYGRFDISIPADHITGEMNYPGRVVDPATDFVATQRYGYSSLDGFRRDLGQKLRNRSDRSVVVFVHGYNSTFGEGMMRLAQLSHDLELPGVAVHYSWPSLGNPLGYSYDHDSVLFGRDGLEELLEQIAGAGAQEVLLVGHSIGTLLVMETLRQIEIKSQGRANRIVDGVILISPDVDIDVFRSQVSRIETLPDPFVIFHSRRDRALALSARLTGQSERLGNISDVERVADIDVTLLDVSLFGQGLNHFPVGDSPALLAVLARVRDVGNAFEGDLSGRTGLFPGTVLTLQNATQVILSPTTVQR